MAEIEDLASGLVVGEEGRIYASSAVVYPRAKKNLREAGARNVSETLPEGRLVYVRTFGCAHNVSDSEFMMGVLASEGYAVTSDFEKAAEADAWLINSCTVKDPSEAAFARVAREGLAANKAVVVAGCVPQGDRRALEALPGASAVGVKALDRVGEAVAASLRGETFVALSARMLPELELPKVRKNELVEIVPLSTGCLGACSYCKTRHARGKLGSYPLLAIERRVRAALQDGVAEIWLSSEDTGAYGIDLGTSLTNLLDALIATIDAFGVEARRPCPTLLRVGMTNPPYVLDQLEGLARCLRHPNVYAFIHVPVQSGSDAVLAKDRMNREYTVADFEAVVDGLRDRVPDGLTVSTDVICGFPGETEADFAQTLDLVRNKSLAICNISQFYARAGTKAADMRPRVPTALVKARSRKLTALVRDHMDPYRRLLGHTLRCFARDEIADGGARLVAHTKTYVKVLVPFDLAYVGAHLDVTVTAVHRWHVDAHVDAVALPANPDDRPALAAALARLKASMPGGGGGVVSRSGPRRSGSAETAPRHHVEPVATYRPRRASFSARLAALVVGPSSSSSSQTQHLRLGLCGGLLSFFLFLLLGGGPVRDLAAATLDLLAAVLLHRPAADVSLS